MIALPLAVYPAALMAAGALVRKRKEASFTILPRVSCLIAARNEAGCIAARIENLLNQDYPGDRLEIMWAPTPPMTTPTSSFNPTPTGASFSTAHRRGSASPT